MSTQPTRQNLLVRARIRFRWFRPLLITLWVAASVMCIGGLFSSGKLHVMPHQFWIFLAVAIVLFWLWTNSEYAASGELVRLNKLFGSMHCSQCRFEGVEPQSEDLVYAKFRTVIDDVIYDYTTDRYERDPSGRLVKYIRRTPREVTKHDELTEAHIRQKIFYTLCQRCGHEDKWELEPDEKRPALLLYRNGKKYTTAQIHPSKKGS